MKIRPVGTEMSHVAGRAGRQTGRHDEDDSRFPRNFANAPKNGCSFTNIYVGSGVNSFSAKTFF